jgi:hypothetical protein
VRSVPWIERGGIPRQSPALRATRALGGPDPFVDLDVAGSNPVARPNFQYVRDTQTARALQFALSG